jgi:organic hydroperoxide reductase OsmC/OhrA
MHPSPHRYRVSASGEGDGDVRLTAVGLPVLRSASPAEFGGPGDRWSPETLLAGAVADCFILTFRAVARAAGVSWTSLECEVTGTLDRVERVAQFTRFDVRAHLRAAPGTDVDRARQAMEKAERHCLISSSLKGEVHLQATIELDGARTIDPTCAAATEETTITP